MKNLCVYFITITVVSATIPKGNSAGQCEHLTSFPPDPESGCCGQEVADDDRITGGNAHQNGAPAHTHYWAQPPHYFSGKSWTYLQKRPADGNTTTVQVENRITGGYAHQYGAPAHTHYWAQPLPFFSGKPWTYRHNLQKRPADGKTTTVKVENRITGGRETELYQYPWTVLLLTMFVFGNREEGFSCGGSLISTKYVLSAGHCVYKRDASVKSVAVNLAEYDKRTFPRDCKVSQREWKCIENIVIYAENITVHPQYEEGTLLNDISLIRLQRSVPYTKYIRPICLPSINIDVVQFSNLQLEVAGWGLNGQYISNVKQSTVLHLVNRNHCRRFYPMLTTNHLCAAGYKGEDTCQGDSGGPLMTLNRGRYYASGLVSGKRLDSPCGNPVPTLYTNVYHYLYWIRSTIRS